ncbi:SDR family NAD(P)-dependent oxidoreductase [Thiocapsa marina]|uniref:Short-chain dehydrogenase/reductase SDR n=1 Tax=Thiocapsa marina 5811 TaxID=768671 RepID=F9U6T9_9GAMM|nr:SDR family NAD(P)-dependent oxidoreductase [Thiocapsa marina]EGV19965.1 short-chain dehydrogenase/reductase SDR [Thiocapsa marina 5811]
MPKTIFITGSTDGIGLAAAQRLAAEGHRVLLHGRNPQKLEQAQASVAAHADDTRIDGYIADLSNLAEVAALAETLAAEHPRLDVLINNAGIFKTPKTRTRDGLDVRFAVNTLAPYLLTQRLLPVLGPDGRVVNLSSAAQSPVDPEALAGRVALADDFAAYAQSKLALTMWSRALALSLDPSLGGAGPAVIAVNPGSMLGTKMVKDGFGVAGADIRIGAEILVRAALSEEFAGASGLYFDNDKGRFAAPHADALDAHKCAELVRQIDAVLDSTSSH